MASRGGELNISAMAIHVHAIIIPLPADCGARHHSCGCVPALHWEGDIRCLYGNSGCYPRLLLRFIYHVHADESRSEINVIPIRAQAELILRSMNMMRAIEHMKPGKNVRAMVMVKPDKYKRAIEAVEPD